MKKKLKKIIPTGLNQRIALAMMVSCIVAGTGLLVAGTRLVPWTGWFNLPFIVVCAIFVTACASQIYRDRAWLWPEAFADDAPASPSWNRFQQIIPQGTSQRFCFVMCIVQMVAGLGFIAWIPWIGWLGILGGGWSVQCAYLLHRNRRWLWPRPETTESAESTQPL